MLVWVAAARLRTSIMSTTSEPTPSPDLTGTAAPTDGALPRPSLSVRRWLWLLFTIAWTIALQVPKPFKETGYPPIDEGLFTFSKTVHVAAYAVFTVLSAWMALPVRYRWLLLVFLIGHAMLTEYVQYLLHDICGRTGQWSDVGLDAIGIGIGAACTWKSWRARADV
jgi:hypothetical protein